MKFVYQMLLENEEELAKLPDGTVIFDNDHDVIVRDQGKWVFWDSDEGEGESAVINYPVLVVYHDDTVDPADFAEPLPTP